MNPYHPRDNEMLTDGWLAKGETAKLMAENASLRAALTTAREALEDAIQWFVVLPSEAKTIEIQKAIVDKLLTAANSLGRLP